MDSFEKAFDNAERVADLALKANQDLAKQLRRLKKASQDGNLTAVKREQESLASTLDALTATISSARQAWSLDDAQVARHLKSKYGFAAELRRAAAEKGINVRQQNGHLICHPSLVHVMPKERAVRIDSKKVSTIRPTRLVELLARAQNAPARFRPRHFLEALYRVYLSLTRESASHANGSRGSPVILLAEVYRLFTSLPGSSRDYTATDFARDLYELDRSGVTKTKSGAVVAFPASTGARTSRNLFSFIGPDGHEVKYFGIRFVEA